MNSGDIFPSKDLFVANDLTESLWSFFGKGWGRLEWERLGMEWVRICLGVILKGKCVLMVEGKDRKRDGMKVMF